MLELKGFFSSLTQACPINIRFDINYIPCYHRNTARRRCYVCLRPNIESGDDVPRCAGQSYWECLGAGLGLASGLCMLRVKLLMRLVNTEVGQIDIPLEKVFLYRKRVFIPCYRLWGITETTCREIVG